MATIKKKNWHNFSASFMGYQGNLQNQINKFKTNNHQK